MASGLCGSWPGPDKNAREAHVYPLAVPESALQSCAMFVLLAIVGRLLWTNPGPLVAFAALAAAAAVAKQVVSFLHCVSSWQCVLRLTHSLRMVFPTAALALPLNCSHLDPFSYLSSGYCSALKNARCAGRQPAGRRQHTKKLPSSACHCGWRSGVTLRPRRCCFRPAWLAAGGPSRAHCCAPSPPDTRCSCLRPHSTGLNFLPFG